MQMFFLGSLDAHKLMEILQNQGIKVRLLDLKRGDIRPGLAKLRNKGIQHFVVDIGQEYLKLFFEEVIFLFVCFAILNNFCLLGYESWNRS